MSKQSQFPYEFQDVEGQEAKEMNEAFTGPAHAYIRVGPKKYFLVNGYKNDAANIYNLPLRLDDVFVASFPRSGTTWVQEAVWLIANDLDYEKAASKPLTARYNFLEFPMFFDSKQLREQLKLANSDKEENLKAIDSMAKLGSEVAATTSSPRFFKTHLPMSLLPLNILEKTKVVYVTRDPRDVAVSYMHHVNLFKFDFQGDFKHYWSLFTRDMVIWSPFFEHVKEAWQLRHHPNMLFLFYEELSKDLAALTRRIAEFFGKQYTDEQITGLCTHLHFDNFKNNTAVNLKELQELGFFTPEESFIRKGKVGGWREYFDQEMVKQADSWISDNLRDTDLRFPHSM